MNQEAEYYDNTRITAFKECPRKYYYRHVRDWRREGTATALIFGLSWHEAMDIVYAMAHSDATDSEITDAAHAEFCKTWEEQGLTPWHLIDVELENEIAPRTPGIAKEMIRNYIKERRDFIRKCTVVDIERPFMVPLFPDENIYYIGRLDKTLGLNGRIIIVEHKTTTAYKVQGNFRTDYLESWSPNSQVDGYLHAAHLCYQQDKIELWVDAALVHKKIHNGFKYIPVSRLTAMLDVWLSETRHWIDGIQRELKNLTAEKQMGVQVMKSFPKNTSSCSNFAGCSYRDLCKVLVNPEELAEAPLGYVEEKWEPFDILNIQSILDKETV